MGTITWTADQERAIATRDRHVLVSAAAGSGKTAVLVERIVRRVTREGGDIDRLLIVTFTDAAAAQMRDRLVQRIHERLSDTPDDAHLLRQLLLLPGASISTLHAFCLKVVRQHFYRLGLDPAFRVLDEHEAGLLRLEALEHALEGMYEAMDPDDDFARLVTAYGGVQGDEALQQFMLNMHAYSRSLPDPEGWLRDSVSAYADLDADEFDGSPWAPELQQLVLVRIGRAERLLRQALTVADGPGGSPSHAETYTADLEQMEQLRRAAASGWTALGDEAHLCTFGRLKPATGDDSDADVRRRGTALRNRAKKIIEEDVRDALLSRPLTDELLELRQLAGPMQALVEGVLRLDEAYTAAKNERGLIDFSDIEHLCLALLDVPEVAEEVGERFDEVLIDESQDLNGVQDAILERISRSPEEGGELFLVGDVKQSVYRFRQADPTLFMARYEDAEADEDAPKQRIDLQANFRSRPVVIDAVNFLFRQLMTEGAGEMDYVPEAELVAGAQYGEEVADSPVQLHVLERERRLLESAAGASEHAEGEDAASDAAGDDEELSAFQREARYAAEHIRRLVSEGDVRVWDGRLGRYRSARYGDIVILLRTVRHKANELVDELRSAGVPAYAELGTGYFAATEVETMMALLKVLDNPRQDIPLATVLRTIVGLSPEELARLRVHERNGDLYDAVVAASLATDGAKDAVPADSTGPDPSPADARTLPLHALPERMGDFLGTLDEWRTLARRAPLSKVVWRLLAETRYFDYVGALPGGRQRQANLRALHERAQQFNHFSRHGLSRFLRFIERLQDADGDLGTAPAVGEADDVVRIMSVHKSKGLEFPIVYVLDAGRQLQAGGVRGHRDLTFHQDLGLGAGLVDGERRVAQPSLLLESVRWRRQREELAEEMRLLYVALTRARERLLIIGSVSDIDRTAAEWAEAAPGVGWPLSDERLLSAGSWLDWVGPAVGRHEDGEPLRDRAREETGMSVHLGDPAVARDGSTWAVYVGGEASTDARAEDADEAPLTWAEVAALQPLPDEPLSAAEAAAAVEEPFSGDGRGDVRARLQERFDWAYPHRAVVGRAAKQSVSELKRRWDAMAVEETAPVTGYRRRLDDRPAFLHAAGRPLTAAERGSAVHLVLQHVDLTTTLDAAGLEKEIRGLEAREMLTAEQAQAVRIDRLAAFFASPLGRRLQTHADKVQREVPFTMALPATEAYPDVDPGVTRDEVVIVQGIVDCLVPDEDGLLLIDFKTDRVTESGLDAAAAAYASQVKLYARAAEHMYGRPVREAYLVFLSVGKAVRVPTS